MMSLIDYFPKLSVDESEFFNITTQRKLDFLSSKILDLGYVLQFSKVKEDLFFNLVPYSDIKNAFDEFINTNNIFSKDIVRSDK